MTLRIIQRTQYYEDQTHRLRWLQSLLPIRPEAPESGFQRRVRADGSSRWGCKVCAVHRVKGMSPQLQRFQLRPHAARLPNLLRHGQSQSSHAVATKAYGGSPGDIMWKKVTIS